MAAAGPARIIRPDEARTGHMEENLPAGEKNLSDLS